MRTSMFKYVMSFVTYTKVDWLTEIKVQIGFEPKNSGKLAVSSFIVPLWVVFTSDFPLNVLQCFIGKLKKSKKEWLGLSWLYKICFKQH